MPSETALPSGVPKCSAIEPLFVNAVARFVQDAEEGLVEVARIVARGEPAIAGADAAAEGMHRGVEPAGVEVEADGRRRRLSEDELAIDRIFALQNVAFRLAARCRRCVRPAAPARCAVRAKTCLICAVVAPGSYSSSRAS